MCLPSRKGNGGTSCALALGSSIPGGMLQTRQYAKQSNWPLRSHTTSTHAAATEENSYAQMRTNAQPLTLELSILIAHMQCTSESIIESGGDMKSAAFLVVVIFRNVFPRS